jgi:hypothetical protein
MATTYEAIQTTTLGSAAAELPLVLLLQVGLI